MELTPLDVRKKKDDFKRGMRGYDPAQVDAFLEMCADRLDALVQRDKEQQRELAALRERLSAFEERERALNEALVTAQELREEARAQAEKSADLKLREAEHEAAAIRERAEAATEAARHALEDLKVRRSGFLRSLRWSLERFMGEIEEEERRLAAVEPDAEPAAGPGDGAAASDGAERAAPRPDDAGPVEPAAEAGSEGASGAAGPGDPEDGSETERDEVPPAPTHAAEGSETTS